MAVDIVEQTITGKTNGNFWQNVIHWDCTTSGTPSKFDIAKAMNNAWAANVMSDWLEVMPEDSFLSSVRARVLTTGGGPAHTLTNGVAGNGGAREGATQSASVGATLIFPSVDAGNVHIGKIFLPGAVSEDLLNGVFQPTYLGLCQVLIDTLMANVTMLGPAAGTARYKIFQRSTEIMFTPDGGYVSPRIGTQRRRLSPVA